MPTYDPRWWDWYNDDHGNLHVERKNGSTPRTFTKREWSWDYTELGGMKVVRRSG